MEERSRMFSTAFPLNYHLTFFEQLINMHEKIFVFKERHILLMCCYKVFKRATLFKLKIYNDNLGVFPTPTHNITVHLKYNV